MLIGEDAHCRILSALYQPQHCLPLPKTRAALRQVIQHHAEKNTAFIVIVESLLMAQRLLPCAVVAACSVGIVLADMLRPSSTWLIQQKNSIKTEQSTAILSTNSDKQAYAILAQWMDQYTEQGRHWLQTWHDAPPHQHPIENWMADHIDGNELCEKLATGARCCVYFGHGRPYGFSAYHGVYLDDILAIPHTQMIDCLLSFACYHLTETRTTKSFAQQLCEAGRVGAFWGSLQAVDSQDNARLAAIALAASQQADVVSLGQWLCAVDSKVSQTKDIGLQTVWQSYRLIGSPQLVVF